MLETEIEQNSFFRFAEIWSLKDVSWELEMAVENGDIDRSTVFFFFFVFVQRWRRRGVVMYRERNWEIIIIIKRVKEKGKNGLVRACVRVVCE